MGLVKQVFGRDVLGAYLHGSAVLGGLKPHSDIDILVVLLRHTTADERREVVDRLLEISGARARDGPGRPVELTMVVQSDIRPWRYPPRSEFLYGEWLRDEYESGLIPSPAASPDLAVLLTMVLKADRPLLGPPASEVLDPVPDGDLRRAIVDGVPGLLDELGTDTRNVLLTLVRIWATLATGQVTSKDGAADWALSRLPKEHRSVLAQARAAYLAGDEESWDDLMPRVQALADHLVLETERASASGTLTR